MAEVGATSLRKADAATDHAVLRFAADVRTRRQLEAIVAAERRCCSFLRMSLREGEFLDLRIEAPPSAEPILREIVGAFRGERTVA